MRKGSKKIGFGLVAVALSIVLLLTAAMPICEAGRDEKVVKIGFHCAFTGLVASTLVHAHYGSSDYVRYVNEQGGINGVKIDWLWEDVGIHITKSVMAHKRFKAAGVVFEWYGVSSCLEALTPTLGRDEVPALYSANFSPGMVTHPIRWVFGSINSCDAETATFMKWIKDNWTQQRPPRIGIMAYDLASGWDAVRAGPDWASKLGIEWVGHEVVPLTVIDTSTEWVRLMAKNPDWVWVAATAAPLVPLAKDSKRLGAQEKGIKICTYAAGLDEIILKPIGDGAEGWYAMRPHPSYTETDLPGVRFSFELAKKYRGFEPKEVASHYRAGMIEVAVMLEAIRLAMEKVGLENLNGRAVRDAMVSIKDFETGMTPLITVTEERPYLFSAERVYQVRQGELWPVTDWIPSVFHPLEEPKGIWAK